MLLLHLQALFFLWIISNFIVGMIRLVVNFFWSYNTAASLLWNYNETDAYYQWYHLFEIQCYSVQYIVRYDTCKFFSCLSCRFCFFLHCAFLAVLLEYSLYKRISHYSYLWIQWSSSSFMLLLYCQRNHSLLFVFIITFYNIIVTQFILKCREEGSVSKKSSKVKT